MTASDGRKLRHFKSLPGAAVPSAPELPVLFKLEDNELICGCDGDSASRIDTPMECQDEKRARAAHLHSHKTDMKAEKAKLYI
jgi:hypothetical protein